MAYEKFHAYEVSLELVRAVRGAVEKLGSRNPDLARQLGRALTSVPLNISEGRRRVGRDRLHLWRVASGSAAELVTGLQVSEALGHLESADITGGLELGDRLLAMLWKLTH